MSNFLTLPQRYLKIKERANALEATLREVERESRQWHMSGHWNCSKCGELAPGHNPDCIFAVLDADLPIDKDGKRE